MTREILGTNWGAALGEQLRGASPQLSIPSTHAHVQLARCRSRVSIQNAMHSNIKDGKQRHMLLWPGYIYLETPALTTNTLAPDLLSHNFSANMPSVDAAAEGETGLISSAPVEN